MTPAHIAAVQVLRAIAALSVFAFHLASSLVSDFGIAEENFFEIGASGVDIFFVISGFIICYTTRENQDFRRFVIKRCARIMPLYYLLTLGVFGIALAAPQLLNATTADPLNLLKSLAFIPYMREDSLVYPLLFLGWTLNYEMFFYGLFAVALLTRSNRIFVVAALLVAFYGFGLAYEGNSVPLGFYTSGIILEFLWGCLVFLVYDNAPHLLRHVRHLWPLAIALLLVQNFYPVDLPQEFSKGLPAALLLASLLTISLGNSATARFFARLGDASYSIYLIHPYVIQAFVKIAVPLLGVSLPVIAVVSLASLAATLVASLLLWSLFERPSNRWLCARLLQPSAAAAARSA